MASPVSSDDLPPSGRSWEVGSLHDALTLARELRAVTGQVVKVRPVARLRVGRSGWRVRLAPGAPPRVLIVDDAASFRRAVRELLERRGYVVVGEASSAAAALEAADRLRPDAVLLDVHLPDASGLDVCAALCRTHPAPAVLLASMYDLPGRGGPLEDCGARGLVLKSELASADLETFWPRAG